MLSEFVAGKWSVDAEPSSPGLVLTGEDWSKMTWTSQSGSGSSRSELCLKTVGGSESAACL